MTYCTFSRECDLYCFRQVEGGYVTIVAKNRPKFAVLADMQFDTAEEFMQSVQKQVDSLQRRKVSSPAIGLPADGQEFLDPDLPALLARVQSLQAMGYRVPDEVVSALQADLT